MYAESNSHVGTDRESTHDDPGFQTTAERAVRPWKGGVGCVAVEATRWNNSLYSAAVASGMEQDGSPWASARTPLTHGADA